MLMASLLGLALMTQTVELGQKTVDQVPGLYDGRLEDMDLVKLLNSQTP